MLRRRDGPRVSVNGFSALCGFHVTARRCASLRRRLPKHATNNGKVVSCSKLKADSTRDASASGACARFAHMCTSAEVQCRRSTATTTRELELTSYSSSLFRLSAGLVTRCTRPVISLACLALALRPPSLLVFLLAFSCCRCCRGRTERAAQGASPRLCHHARATKHKGKHSRAFQHPSLPLPLIRAAYRSFPWLCCFLKSRRLLFFSPPYSEDHACVTAPCAFLHGVLVIPFLSAPLTRR